MTQTGTKSINLSEGSVKEDLHYSWKELSDRKSTTVPIIFPERFTNTPIVTLGLIGLYAVQGSEAFGVEAHDITERGFNIVLTVTYEDKTRMLKFQWLATDA